jgi:hypothetical protein
MIGQYSKFRVIKGTGDLMEDSEKSGRGWRESIGMGKLKGEDKICSYPLHVCIFSLTIKAKNVCAGWKC